MTSVPGNIIAAPIGQPRATPQRGAERGLGKGRQREDELYSQCHCREGKHCFAQIAFYEIIMCDDGSS